MNKGHKETISIRVVSCAFIVLALAIFKPFGLEVWQWQAYIHLLGIFALGIGSCLLTEVILKYVVRMPLSYDRDVSYIIRRNQWFQLINTPLVSLLICLYRHFVMSDLVEGNKFSLSNYLGTLVIIAFLSFAIGLYWRFKFRSRYLAAELEEMRKLNEQLQRIQKAETLVEKHTIDNDVPPSSTVILTGTTNDTVTLGIADLLYLEAEGNYVKVCYLRDGQLRNDMLRATSKQVEDELQPYPMVVRCHRAFLVNLQQVEQIVSKAGTMQLIIKHRHESIPVSRSNMMHIKEAIRGM